MANDSLKYHLSQCMRENVNGYTVEALIAEYPTMQELMNATEEELKLVKGIGMVKAKQLAAILEFVRYAHGHPESERVVIKSPLDIYEMVRGEMEYLQTEHFMVIGLSTKNHVITRHIVSKGSLNASIVHPRETFRMLIRRACAGAILVHNHPSGDPSPSIEDITLTRQLAEAGKVIDIPILDHLIVGQGKFYSMKEQGMI
jgi:DNA repair protein RadC